MIVRYFFKRRALLVVTFPSRSMLNEVVTHIMEQGLSVQLDIGHAAMIARSADGALSIRDNSVTVKEGTLCGMMLGATLLGLGAIQYGALDIKGTGEALVLGISFLIGGALGSLIGYLTARWIGFGFPPDLVQSVKDRLGAGEVALVLQVRRPHANALWDALVSGGAHIEDHSAYPIRPIE